MGGSELYLQRPSHQSKNTTVAAMQPKPVATPLPAPKVPDGAAAASFVRLNTFLLRTHITSIVSALAEGGWLEVWEKDRICRFARDDTSAAAQSFLKVYARFMETHDVLGFVT